MGNAIAIGEAIIILKDIFDSSSDFLSKPVSDNFYKTMDDMAFLTSKFLGIGSNGEFLDKTEKIAEAIMSLSNIVIWAVLLFYCFKSLFGYFLSKKVDVPWKFFIRIIIFGILANASFFICYTGVYFSENFTGYIRSYIGEDNASFEILEGYIDSELEASDDKADIYTIDALMSIFIYFLTFFTAVCLGGRYILIKALILLSPIFFVIGGIKCGEKIFYRWVKSFFTLLFMQIFFSVILGCVSFSGGDSLFIQILVCGLLAVFSRNVFRFLILK